MSTVTLTQASHQHYDIDVKRDYQAAGNGTSDDTSALLSAYAAAPSGGVIFYPPGTYLANAQALQWNFNGMKHLGAGRNASILKTTVTGQDLVSIGAGVNKLTIESLTLQNTNTAGHLLAPAGSIQTLNVIDSSFVQNNPAKSIWKHTDAGYIDSMWLGCILTHNGATSVPAFDFTAATISRYNSNSWIRCQVNNEAAANTWFFDFATSSATDFNYDNVFRDITGETNNGGFARVLTGHGFVFDNVNIYDLTTTTKDLFYVGKGAGGLLSRYAMFRRVGRRGGTLGGGLNDIKLESSSGAAHAFFEYCNTANLAGFTVDCGSNVGVVTLGCDNTTFTNQPQSFIQMGRRGRVQAEVLMTKVKAGAIVDGDFSQTPGDGALAVDSTNGRLYVRYGAAWHFVGLT